MANNFMNLDSRPELYIMIPPPSYRDGDYDIDQ